MVHFFTVNHVRKFSIHLFAASSPGSPATNKELMVLLRTASWVSALPMVTSKAWWFQREEYGAETFGWCLEVKNSRMDGGDRNGLLYFLIQWKWRGEANIWGKSVRKTLLATAFMFGLKVVFGSLQKVTCIYTQSLRSFNGQHLSQISPKKFIIY